MRWVRTVRIHSKITFKDVQIFENHCFNKRSGSRCSQTQSTQICSNGEGFQLGWGKKNGHSHRVKLSRAESSWVKLTNSSHLVTEFLPDSDPPVTRCLFANQPPATYGKLNLDESWLDLGDGIFVLAFHTQQNMQYTVHSVHTAAYMLTQLSMVESLCGNCRSKALLLQKTSRRKRRLKTCLPPFAPCSSHAWACHEKIHGTLVLLILKI